jgi:phage recombination protein Bet
MAQQARERQALTIAPRYTKPGNFAGTDAAWRSLCECYPSAETPEVVMAVVEYCAVRHLDPYKNPVHVVPMWNSKLRRRVQVVMRGINEIEITASRTGKWAGMDEAEFGPMVPKTFSGEVENDDGSKRKVEVSLEYPEWCRLSVYRLVGNEKARFTARVWFVESYGRAGFRTEVPNERWTKAPRQMLEKCTKAAVLRAAFPEEGLGYAAEEMEDRPIETGGVTIDGKIDHGDPGLSDRDRRIEQPPPSAPSGEPTLGLDEPNGSKWLLNLHTLLASLGTASDVVELRRDKRVLDAYDRAPSTIKSLIDDAFRRAHERLTPPVEEPPPNIPENIPTDDDWPDDPIRDLLAEVEEMDLDALDTLTISTAWKVKTRDLFPPDRDRLDEAIALRRALLKGGKAT